MTRYILLQIEERILEYSNVLNVLLEDNTKRRLSTIAHHYLKDFYGTDTEVDTSFGEKSYSNDWGDRISTLNYIREIPKEDYDVLSKYNI